MAVQEMETGLRLRLGTIIFVVSFYSPALIPLVAGSSLDTEWKTVLSGLLAFGIPELGVIIAVAIMGKPGFEMIKNRLLARLRLMGFDQRRYRRASFFNHVDAYQLMKAGFLSMMKRSSYIQFRKGVLHDCQDT